MNYFLFLDESGDHGLSSIDPSFPIFVLCGVIISEPDYLEFRRMINAVKMKYWDSIDVVFHSSDIRKLKGPFASLLKKEIKEQFYEDINNSIASANYKIISAVIRKERYIQKYGKLSNDIYEISLSFIIERAIFCLDSEVIGHIPPHSLKVIIEKRGKKEDSQLRSHTQSLLSKGTYFVPPARLKQYDVSFTFTSKRENINGLQLADLVAYPIARLAVKPGEESPIKKAYDLLFKKFYRRGNRVYGLKVFP